MATELIMDTKSIIAYNLKKIKSARSLSRKQVAALTGISYREISKIEHLEVSITLDTLDKLAAGLNVTAAELVSK